MEGTSKSKQREKKSKYEKIGKIKFSTLSQIINLKRIYGKMKVNDKLRDRYFRADGRHKKLLMEILSKK